MESFRKKDWLGKRHKKKPGNTTVDDKSLNVGAPRPQIYEGLISYKEFRADDDLVTVEGYGRVSRRQAKELCLEKLQSMVQQLQFNQEVSLNDLDLAKAFYVAFRG